MKTPSALALVAAASLLSACADQSPGTGEANRETAAPEPRRSATKPVEDGRTPTTLPLDELFNFADPYECHAGAEFRALLDGLLHWEEAGETYRGVLRSPPVPGRFRAQVGTPHLTVEGNEYRATLPLRGTWQNLPLQSVVLVAWVESESGFYLVFDATPEQVVQAANRAGLRIPASGSEYRDGEVLGVNVGVEQYGRGAALYCIAG